MLQNSPFGTCCGANIVQGMYAMGSRDGVVNEQETKYMLGDCMLRSKHIGMIIGITAPYQLNIRPFLKEAGWVEGITAKNPVHPGKHSITAWLWNCNNEIPEAFKRPAGHITPPDVTEIHERYHHDIEEGQTKEQAAEAAACLGWAR